jgi:hypothetical protein
MRAYPRRKSRLYKSLALRYGEAKQQKDRLWTQQVTCNYKLDISLKYLSYFSKLNFPKFLIYCTG